MARWKMNWSEVEQACNDLVEVILATQPRDRRIDYILAVGKGGLIPAGLIWQKFPKAKLGVVHIKAYQNGNRLEEVEFLTPIPERPHNCSPENVLVVDDICDSGSTFRALAQYGLAHAQFCAMLVREGNDFPLNYSKWVAPSPGWVDFPWERMESVDLP